MKKIIMIFGLMIAAVVILTGCKQDAEPDQGEQGSGAGDIDIEAEFSLDVNATISADEIVLSNGIWDISSYGEDSTETFCDISGLEKKWGICTVNISSGEIFVYQSYKFAEEFTTTLSETATDEEVQNVRDTFHEGNEENIQNFNNEGWVSRSMQNVSVTGKTVKSVFFYEASETYIAFMNEDNEDDNIVRLAHGTYGESVNIKRNSDSTQYKVTKPSTQSYPASKTYIFKKR